MTHTTRTDPAAAAPVVCYQIKHYDPESARLLIEPCDGSTGINIIFYLDDHQAKFVSLGRYALRNEPVFCQWSLSLYDFIDLGDTDNYANGEPKQQHAAGRTTQGIADQAADDAADEAADPPGRRDPVTGQYSTDV